MAMCYLCDLCKQPHEGDERGFVSCRKRWYRWKKLAIDYGRDDPKEICEHFEPKEDGDD